MDNRTNSEDATNLKATLNHCFRRFSGIETIGWEVKLGHLRLKTARFCGVSVELLLLWDQCALIRYKGRKVVVDMQDVKPDGEEDRLKVGYPNVA